MCLPLDIVHSIVMVSKQRNSTHLNSGKESNIIETNNGKYSIKYANIAFETHKEKQAYVGVSGQ